MKIKTWISFPRWENVREMLFDYCKTLGIDFKVIDVDKGFITTTLYFEVSGDLEKIKKFKSALYKWLK